MIQYTNAGITVFESALFRTTSTLIHTPDLILLVDPTWLPGEIARIKAAFEEIQDHRPAWLLFTHSDYDHIIARMAFPDLPVIASRSLSDNPEKENIIRQILDFDDEYYIKRSYPIHYPEVDYLVESDGQELQIGDTLLRFYLAPGHNSDGIFTIIQNEGIWLAGDYLSDIEFPYIYHSSYDYERTLKKAAHILESGQVSLLVPGHGSVSTDKKEIADRIAESETYIRTLRQAVEREMEFDVSALWQRYDFPKIMGKFHQGNTDLIRRELKKEV